MKSRPGALALALSMVLVPAFRAGAFAATAPPDTLYLHPGPAIDTGSVRLNLVCAGRGSPAVIFDAGLGDWSPAWSRVQPAIAATTRACTYDRAGYGWSAAGPSPRDSMQIVSELHGLLGAAGISPPYILVGHSFGGYNMRLFADRYLDEAGGLVLVDSSHEDQQRLIDRTDPADGAGWSAMVRTLERCRSQAAAGRLSERARGFPACAGQFFRGLPERQFSAALNAVIARALTRPAPYAAMLAEAQTFRTRSADEVRRARRSFGELPLRILTGTHHSAAGPHTPAAQRRRDADFERGWQALQRSWLALSSDARQTLARHSGHYVQLDEPQLVIAAIREEIGLARLRARVTCATSGARFSRAPPARARKT
jgi:pimeloyl-ACP methyl ester carboxylesterase